MSIYKDVLDQAVAESMLPESFDSASEAQLIQDLWSGATHRAVINRNAEPVHHAVEHLKNRISSMSI